MPNIMVRSPEDIKVFVLYLKHGFDFHELNKIIDDKKYLFVIGNQQGIPNSHHVEYISWRFGLPNIQFHCELVKKTNSSSREIAYISDDFDFIQNARNLTSLTILIKSKDEMSYNEYAGYCPDVICNSLLYFINRFQRNRLPYAGEHFFASIGSSDVKYSSAGKFIRFHYSQDKQKDFHIAVAGRYFGVKHYLNAVDRYSHALIANKINGKNYRKFDDIFAGIYINMIQAYIDKFKINIEDITSVPEKPGKERKFSRILSKINKNFDFQDISADFICSKQISDNKTLSSSDRALNTKGVYKYYGSSLKGRRVAIIDDVVTTGSTLASSVSELYSKGASNVVCFALAVNQYACDIPFPEIQEDFKNRWRLRFNSRTLKPFFSNYNGTQTIEYNDGLDIFTDLFDEKVHSVQSVDYKEDYQF